MTQARPQTSDTLYRHRTRKEWGLAMLAWEREGKRAFQFEDGELRIFKEGYYGLLEEVPAGEGSGAIMARLESKRSGVRKDDKRKRGESSSSSASTEDLPTLGEQILVFRAQYPRGFDDPKWIEEQRGAAGRGLKRHREQAIKRAQQELAKDSLDALLGAGQTRSVIERVCTVLDKTDLVPKSQVDPVRAATRDSRLAQAIRDYLHSDDVFEHRFAGLCKALSVATKKPPQWQIATVLAALVHPGQHVCVRPTVFSQQARTMAPKLRTSKAPTPSAYTAYLEMVRAIDHKLRSEREEPRDLLDVHDFVWASLRPGAGEILERIRRQAAGEDVPEPVQERSAPPPRLDDDDDDDDEPIDGDEPIDDDA